MIQQLYVFSPIIDSFSFLKCLHFTKYLQITDPSQTLAIFSIFHIIAIQLFIPYHQWLKYLFYFLMNYTTQDNFKYCIAYIVLCMLEDSQSVEL